jgi:hypothetical protein
MMMMRAKALYRTHCSGLEGPTTFESLLMSLELKYNMHRMAMHVAAHEVQHTDYKAPL